MFGADMPAHTIQNDGTNGYNYETSHIPLMGLLGALGLGKLGIGARYYTAQQNLKYYYKNALHLQDCINLYCDIAAQVMIEEVDAVTGVPVEKSEFVKMLEKPNVWQNRTDFIKEMVINVLTTGISVQYGNFFLSGDLKTNAQIFNVDFNNIKMPAIKNPYAVTRRDIRDLIVIEEMDSSEQRRKLKMGEIAYFYDTVPHRGYGDGGKYNSETFLNPMSRLFPILASIHTLINAQDTMCYLTNNPVNTVLATKDGQLAQLPGHEKHDIETKLAGHGKYGAGMGKIGDVVVSSEALDRLDLTRDVKKMQIPEMKESAKLDVEQCLNIPKDFFGDSTYENKQFSEARLTLNNVKTITDNWLQELSDMCPKYFEAKGTKLIGTYDHMPSVIEARLRLKNMAFKDKAAGLTSLFNAFKVFQEINPDATYEQFLKENDLEQFVKADQ